jgi:hypothetical protein
MGAKMLTSGHISREIRIRSNCISTAGSELFWSFEIQANTSTPDKHIEVGKMM